MIELLRTSNPVQLSFVKSLLEDAGFSFTVLDQNMSIMEGSLGILQPRIMVEEAYFRQARALLEQAGVEKE